jgi:hypothetical protein
MSSEYSTKFGGHILSIHWASALPLLSQLEVGPSCFFYLPLLQYNGLPSGCCAHNVSFFFKVAAFSSGHGQLNVKETEP